MNAISLPFLTETTLTASILKTPFRQFVRNLSRSLRPSSRTTPKFRLSSSEVVPWRDALRRVRSFNAATTERGPPKLGPQHLPILQTSAIFTAVAAREQLPSREDI